MKDATFCYFFIVPTVLLCSVLGMAAEKNISLATLNWEPYIGEKLKNYGFGAEIITKAFSRTGYKVKFIFMPWVRTLKDVEIGKYDALCFAYYSDERAKKYAFSHAFAESSLVFCKHKDAHIAYKTLPDLKPYRIGVVRGYVNTPEFDAAEYLEKEEVKNEMLK